MAFLNSFQNQLKNLSSNTINKSLSRASSESGIVPVRILPNDSILEKASKAKTSESFTQDKYGRKREEDVYSVPPAVLRKMYRYNPVVRAAADTIVNEIVSAKWQISLIDIEEKQTDKIKEKIKEIEFFFRHPNKNKENFKTLLRKVVLDLLLLDAGVIEKVPYNSKEGIAEIYAIDGATIRIKTDDYGMIEEYWQVLDDKDKDPVRFGRDELIYLQAWSRTESVYGLSPLETLHNSITAFLYAETYNVKFFENNATPRGIIDLGGSVPERELDRFRQFWEAEQQQKPHRLMILGNIGTPEKPGTGVKWIPIAMQPKDYDMAKYLEWLMKIILMVYGITPSKVGWTEEIKGAPATGQILQSQAFKERAVFPIMEKIAWYLTEEIVHRSFGSDLLKFEFVEEMSLQDKLLKAQIHQYEIMGQWKTPQEIRKEEGLSIEGEGINGQMGEEGEGQPDFADLFSGLKGEEKPSISDTYEDLENNVRDFLNKKNGETKVATVNEEVRSAFDDLKTDIKSYIGKSIKTEINKSLKSILKKKKHE